MGGSRMGNNETSEKTQNSLITIFFDMNLPGEPLRKYLACIKPYARLWFANEPNYFTLHSGAFNLIKNRFLFDTETPFLRSFFQKVQTTRPTIMADHELYLYIGMLAELFYPETPCVFFTGDRHGGKIRKRKGNAPNGRRTALPKETIPCGFPRVLRAIRVLNKEGMAHDEFEIQSYESLRGFPGVMRCEFEREEYQGIILKNIPIVQVGTHGSDIAHRIIAEQVIKWFNRSTGKAIAAQLSCV